MKIWLYLHFPDLYLHSLFAPQQQSQRQCLQEQPLAILQQPAAGRQHYYVWQRNQAAARAGVEADMPLASALCFCPALQTRLAEPHKNQQLLQQKASWAYQFSARVSIDPPQGLWLEVSSMLSLFGGLEALCQRIRQAAQQQQWPLQLGLAHQPLAARILAHQHLSDPHQYQPALLAASSQQLLHGLTLEQLDFPAEQQLALQRLGIHHYAQLQALPSARLSDRFDRALVCYLSQLNGTQQPMFEWFQPPLTFSEEAHFIQEVEHINGLLFPLKRQLASLSIFLQQRQLAVSQLRLQLKHRQPADQAITDSHWSIRFARPEYRQHELMTLLRYQLEKRHLSAPVRELTLSATHFIAQQQQQQDYWPQQAGGQQPGETLLNRLQARLQPQQLCRLSSSGDARPDFAWHSSDPLQPYPQNQSRLSATPQPLWLLPQPRSCVAPRDIISGPQRISSGWWQAGGYQRRDYYQVRQQQQLLWVFRDEYKRWFIHGYFS